MLRLEDVDLPAPGPGQVLVRQTAAGVNYRDIYRREGRHPVEGFPALLGVEGAGTVEAIGDGVEGISVGQRVVAQGGGDGAYADSRIVPAWRTLALPDDIDDRTRPR